MEKDGCSSSKFVAPYIVDRSDEGESSQPPPKNQCQPVSESRNEGHHYPDPKLVVGDLAGAPLDLKQQQFMSPEMDSDSEGVEKYLLNTFGPETNSEVNEKNEIDSEEDEIYDLTEESSDEDDFISYDYCNRRDNREVVGDLAGAPLDLKQQQFMSPETESASEGVEKYLLNAFGPEPNSEEDEIYDLTEESSNEDDFISYDYCNRQDNREIFYISLDDGLDARSHCMDLMRESGCEFRFMSLSKRLRCRFYAILNDKEAAKMRRCKGVFHVRRRSSVFIED